MSANRLTKPKKITKYHGRSWGRLLTGGVCDSAKDPALDAKLVADAVRHRQIAGIQLGGVGLQGQQQAGSGRVHQTRSAQRCTTGDPHRGSRADDLLEQLHQVCLLYTSPSPRDGLL